MLMKVINFISCVVPIVCVNVNTEEIASYQQEVWKWMKELNEDLGMFNTLSAQYSWDMAIGKGVDDIKKIIKLFLVKNLWRNKMCSVEIDGQYLTDLQRRFLYLFCRGPLYSSDGATQYLMLMEQMSNMYNSELCSNRTIIRYDRLQLINDSHRPTCLRIEPDLERLMKRDDLTPNELQSIWLHWHNHVGPPMRPVYAKFVRLQNAAARANGYRDIGAAWREELEMGDLEGTAFKLYEEMKELYVMLHAVVRHRLYVKYGAEVVKPYGPIPIHLLGDMWGQDWSSLLPLMASDSVNLNERMARRNWTVQTMVLEAEDMYASWGLPRMTPKFWKYSVFEGSNNLSVCHGTAANLYHDDDYRMLLCAEVSMDDFYVIVHEMGHIQYYMAYKNQPPIFQDGANTAFHESIGDVAMHAILTPQHLNRLGLLKDEEMNDPAVEMALLLKQALSKIPEIPFALLIDTYRWAIFRNQIKSSDYNKVYWLLNEELRGVQPPVDRGEKYFDAGGKFHIPDNTPYIRYFLSNILQMDIYKAFCQLTLFGRTNADDDDDDDGVRLANAPLHRCDLYGSKNIGKRLKKFMEKGSSEHWQDVKEIITGSRTITVSALLEYYQPVYKWLKHYVAINNIPIGW